MADGDDVIPLADEEEPGPGPLVDGPDDSDAPRPAARPAVGQPLPRLWKVAPEPEDDDLPRRKSRRERLAEEKAARAGQAEVPSKKAKPARPKKPVETERPAGKVLLEDTPESETYEARQRARLLIGGAMLGVVGLGIYILYRSIAGGGPPPAPAPDAGTIVTPTPARPPAAGEQEAKVLFGTAQQLAKNGNIPVAMATLEKVVKDYPKTATADEARAALGRPANNLPLFLDNPAVMAETKAPATKPAEPPPAVVQAVTPSTEVKAPSNTVARLDMPANPAEPPRAAMPPSTAAVPAKALPAGFHARTEAGVHSSGWPNQINSDRDGATMVLIPAGAFLQGRDNGPPEEAPEHKVNLGAFYIDQHEVTVRQFNLYLKETGKPAPAKFNPKEGSQPGEGDDLPAVNLTAREAKTYLEWAGKLLPTEAQWEAAARTTDGRPHPWGADDPKWARPRAPRQIDPVMSFPLDQSPYGAFDLAGNAWEYTKDWYDSNYYYQLRGRVTDNPTGPSRVPRPPQVVVKGVSKTWLASGRQGLPINNRYPFVGFRGVLPVDVSAAGPNNAPGGGNSGGMPVTPEGITPF